MSRSLSGLLSRYLVVGALNTAVGYGIFAVCYWALDGRVALGVILAIAHVLAVTFSFLSQGSWVFEQLGSLSRRELFLAWGRSQLSYLGLLLLGLLVNGLLHGWFGISIWASQAVATAIAVLVGWYLNRLVVFRVKEQT